MKHFLAVLLALLLPSCYSGGGRRLECNNLGLADLDATWQVYMYRHTLVAWPDSGNTETRVDEGSFRVVGDQCGEHLVFFGMVGGVDETGAALHGEVTNVNFNGMKYTVVADGYITPESGWITAKSDYGFVTYDTTYTILMQEKVFD